MCKSTIDTSLYHSFVKLETTETVRRTYSFDAKREDICNWNLFFIFDLDLEKNLKV